MNKQLIQVEQNEDPKFQEKKLMALIECATRIDSNGNELFDKQRFADLIVGECIAAVLFTEVRMSSYMASVIETRLGYTGKHFSNKWFIDNWKTE